MRTADTQDHQKFPNEHDMVENSTTLHRRTGTFAVLWLINVIKITLTILMVPIAVIAAGYIMIIIVDKTISSVASSIVQTLSPLCSMPIFYLVPFCSNNAAPRVLTHEPPFSKLAEAQGGLLPVMESAGSGIDMALYFKRSEVKVGDLNTLVKLSEMENKGRISRSLEELGAAMGKVSTCASRISSNVDGIVSTILTVNGYAIEALEAHNEKTNSVTFAIIQPFVAYPASREKVIKIFNMIADPIQRELDILIDTSVITIMTLNELEIILKEIHFHVTQQEMKTTANLGEILSVLWRRVGGDAAKRARFCSNLRLLSEIGKHRSSALDEVSKMLVDLKKLQYDLQSLRLQVATPILPNEPTISLEFHIEKLRRGAELLTEGRLTAKKQQQQIMQGVGDQQRSGIDHEKARA